MSPRAVPIQWRKIAETAGLPGNPGDWLATAKTFLNRPLEDTFFDAEVVMLLAAARRAVEAHCRLTLAPATWVGTVRELPRQGLRLGAARPFCSVEKIEYVAADSGQVVTLDPSVYIASPAAQFCGSVELGDGCDWPDIARRADAVRITVKTGFYDLDGTTPRLPDDVHQALLMTVAALDANHGDGGSGGGGGVTVYALQNVHASPVPEVARVLLAPYVYRLVSVA